MSVITYPQYGAKQRVVHVTTAGEAESQTIGTVLAASTNESLLDAGTTGSVELVGARVTINPGSDAAASTRLTNTFPEVIVINPGESVRITSDVDITEVYIVGLASNTVASGTSTIIHSESTSATTLAAQINYSFAAGVRALEITLLDAFASRYSRISVIGYAS